MLQAEVDNQAWSWIAMDVMIQLVKYEVAVKVEVTCSVMVVTMEGETLVVVGLHQHLHPVPSLKTHCQSFP